MKILFIIMIFLQGVLLSSKLDTLKVDKVDVPFIYEEDRNLPLISMQVIFKNSGSIFDENLSGLSKFSSSILKEGSKKDGSVKFAKKLEDRAIHLDIGVGKETLVIEISSLKEQFSEAVKLLTQLLKDPNITEDSFKKIKLLTLATLDRKESDFDYIANVDLYKSIYKDTPLQNPALGTKKSIEKIRLTDIKGFIDDHLILNNSIVVSGGDLSLDEAKGYAKEILSILKKGKSEKLGYFNISKDAKDVEVKKDTKQAYIYFAAPYNLKYSDKDRYKSRVAMFILGAGGFGSRMMEEIRVKRGLAYSAYSRVNIAKSHSEFFGYLQTKTDKKDESIKLVKEIVAKFVKDGVSKEELEQAKRFLLGSEPLRNETLSQRLSKAFHEYYEGFELGHSKKELKKIEELKLDDLNSFIKSHKEIENLTFSVVTK